MRAASSQQAAAAAMTKTPAARAAPALRLGFLRKVYGILTAQVAFTCLWASCCMYVPWMNGLMVGLAKSGGFWLKVLLLAPTVLSLCFLQFGARDKYPSNYIWLSVLTTGVAMDVGFVCAAFQAAGLGHIILQALVMTLMIFAFLTGFVITSKKDFSYMGGFLAASLLSLVLTGFAGFFFPSLVDNYLYIAAGSLIFCGYMIYDTWRVANTMSVDDYIPATVELYLDIINMFLYLVRLIKKLAEEKKRR
eukprot:TRINITY_DN94538_c0_g1_i1.p1 TRINITY_DN94538_c0_g1~~TRINITY_DN94538_c0_g1_i1.p1  ORF type:complete len:249 (-),score=46.39 TRINITY_DN94538_c0_g1_i1:351-1097(-)